MYDLAHQVIVSIALSQIALCGIFITSKYSRVVQLKNNFINFTLIIKLYVFHVLALLLQF